MDPILASLLAFLALAGPATQRFLELFLGPILGKVITDKPEVKTWWFGFLAFLMGLLEVGFGNQAILGVNPVISLFVLALSISAGSNATNSLAKFAEYKKIAVKP